MTGILLIVLIALWAWASVSMTRLALNRFASRRFRAAVFPPLFLALLSLPVIDEIVGGLQFRTLCKNWAILQIDEKSVSGKSVRLIFDPLNEKVPHKALDILKTRISFQDIESSQEIANSNILSIKGGWLAKLIRISENDSPIFLNSSCSPPLSEHGAAKKYGFKIVN